MSYRGYQRVPLVRVGSDSFENPDIPFAGRPKSGKLFFYGINIDFIAIVRN